MDDLATLDDGKNYHLWALSAGFPVQEEPSVTPEWGALPAPIAALVSNPRVYIYIYDSLTPCVQDSLARLCDTLLYSLPFLTGYLFLAFGGTDYSPGMS